MNTVRTAAAYALLTEQKKKYLPCQLLFCLFCTPEMPYHATVYGPILLSMIPACLLTVIARKPIQQGAKKRI